MQGKLKVWVSWVVALAATSVFAADLSEVLTGAYRSEDSRARDVYRHPQQTLEFFGIKPEMNVVEIWPGGGWYTEVLAPFISGEFIAAHFDPDSPVAYFKNSRADFERKVAAGGVYNNVKLATFDPASGRLTVEAASADAVLTFRNVHNWLGSKSEFKAFELFFQALKPGGVLGVVEHRAKPGTSWEAMNSSGYMTQAYVTILAARAGFVLEEASEINANGADSADHPKGVWTLPPNLRLGDTDREKYLAIGESDRMTLRFRKPVQ